MPAKHGQLLTVGGSRGQSWAVVGSRGRLVVITKRLFLIPVSLVGEEDEERGDNQSDKTHYDTDRDDCDISGREFAIELTFPMTSQVKGTSSILGIRESDQLTNSQQKHSGPQQSSIHVFKIQQEKTQKNSKKNQLKQNWRS